MIIEVIDGCYIHITAEIEMELVNYDQEPEVRVKQIYVPLDGNYSMWTEEQEIR